MIKICNEIPDSCKWQIVKAINKGWSNDKKYYIQTTDGRELLLRISNISQYENKKRDFEAVKRLDDIDILISRPIDFGICDNNQSMCSISLNNAIQNTRASLALLCFVWISS